MGRKAGRDIRLLRHRDPDLDLVRARCADWNAGRGEKREVERHAHRSLVLVLPLAGTRECEADGRRHAAGPGQVLVIPPGRVHACPAARENDRYLALCVPPHEAAPVLAEAGLAPGDLDIGVLDAPELCALLSELALALHSPAPEEDKRGLLREVLALAARLATGPASSDPAEVPGLPPAVDRAMALLAADPLDPPDGAELARAAGLSPAHLTRLFTRTVGAPPRHFLLWLRVRRARELLDQGLPLAQCAAEAGFADQSHLHRAFVRILGLTPGQYAAARNAAQAPDDPGRPPDQ